MNLSPTVIVKISLCKIMTKTDATVLQILGIFFSIFAGESFWKAYAKTK